LRLIHGESDGLPGLIADRYGDTVVLQLTATGPEKWRQAIIGALQRASGCARIYERSDSSVRRLEGLAPVTGWVLGEALRRAADHRRERRAPAVDVVAGHKTGFYLDQRDNRLLTRTSSRQVVRRSTASVIPAVFRCRRWPAARAACCRSTRPALRWRRRQKIWRSTRNSPRTVPNGERPTCSANCAAEERGSALRPDHSRSAKVRPFGAHAERAARAYRDINAFGFRLLNPGGLLMTYSCSGGIRSEHFQQIVADAALGAG
jgi:23S rRNA (cytosine1962-C5)-methyltransferase